MSSKNNILDSEVDELLSVLSDSYRRTILTELLEKRTNVLHYDEVIELLEQKNEVSGRKLQLQLEHNHIPKMEDMGLVNYNEDLEVLEYSADYKSHKYLKSFIDCLNGIEI